MMDAEECFVELLDKIEDAKPGKMFGCLCAKMPNGKAGMMLKDENLIIKISSELAEKENFSVFTPIENRPMNGWYEIPVQYKEHWKKYAEISCSEVAKLPAKKKKPKK